MDDLWVPYRRHAASFALASVPMLLVSLMGVGMGSLPWTIAPLAIAFTPLFIAVILWLVCLAFDRRMRRLAEESPLILHWTFDEERWRRYVEAQGRKLRFAGPIIAILCLALGVFVGGLFARDGQEIGGSVALCWFLVAGAGAALGLYIRSLIRWNVESTLRERLRRGGQLLMGWRGFYLTGEYRPLRGMGQTLTDIGLVEEDGESKLSLTWYVYGGRYSSDQTVKVPIPPGHEAEAQAAVRLLADDEAGGRQG